MGLREILKNRNGMSDEEIENELKAGNNVQLIGFGTFAVKEIPAHEGLNPAKGVKIQIPAKKTCKFKAGSKLATL